MDLDRHRLNQFIELFADSCRRTTETEVSGHRAFPRPKHAHYACSLKVEVRLAGLGSGKTIGGGVLINLCIRGGVLAFPSPLLQGVGYVLRLTEPSVVVLPSRVSRIFGTSEVSASMRYFGLVFDLSPEQEETAALMFAFLDNQ